MDMVIFLVNHTFMDNWTCVALVHLQCRKTYRIYERKTKKIGSLEKRRLTKTVRTIF